MAIGTKKKTASKKTKPSVAETLTIDEDDLQEEETPQIEAVEEVEEVSVAADEKHVVIVMLKTTNSPTVGEWDGVHALGVHQMEEKKAYNVPLHVAQHMLDTDCCTMVTGM